MNSELSVLFSLFLENSVDPVSYSEDDEVFVLDVGVLVSFLGKHRKLREDPCLVIKSSVHLTVNHYDMILCGVGFNRSEIRSYKFPLHLIPDGMIVELDQLPETYSMQVYDKNLNR